MQAVILAAGMATRLRPLTDKCPKCLLDIGGKSILERAILNIKSCLIDSFIIVTGFQADMIRNFISKRFPDLHCVFIHNDRYSETNNAYSLLLAERAIEGSFLLLDSDIVFPSPLIQALLDEKERPCIAINRHQCAEEEMKILMNAKGYVLNIGKDLDLDSRVVESIGFEIFDNQSRDLLFEVLKRRILIDGNENEFYEASFKELVEQGVKFKTVNTTDYPAMEIDSAEDLAQARSLAIHL